MITLQHFHNDHLSDLDYELDEVQRNFTSSAAQALERISERNSKNDFLAFPITILKDEKAVGFFVLDFGNDKLDLIKNSKSVLIRSLSVNPSLQGNGIGFTAMEIIPEFIKIHDFPETKEIVLAVNNKNVGAYKMYLKAGYTDSGVQRPWKDGFQHFLFINI